MSNGRDETMGRALVADLRRTVSGTVLGPQDSGFAEQSQPWSLVVEQRPLAVVHAADVADVVATVRCARQQGVSVATQPVGHGSTEAVQDTILLRTGALHDMTVDVAARRASIGAGVRWRDLLPLLDKDQLVPVAGSSDSTNVVGYTLGGGMSWVGRRYGFAANAVRRFEVVDANGEVAVVTADTDPDLFWALRGGGGDFAIVTAMEFDVFPGSQLCGGRLMWTLDRAPEVLAAFRAVTASAPDELTVWYQQMWLPDLPMVPEPMRGQRLVIADAMVVDGEVERLDPLRAVGGAMLDTIRPLPVGEFASVSADPSDPSPAVVHGTLLHEVDDRVADAFLDLADSPFVALQLRHIGGAFSRTEPGGGAVEPLSEQYLVGAVAMAPTQPARTAVRAAYTALASSFGAAASPQTTFNLLSHEDIAVDHAFSAVTLARLRELKLQRDRQGVLRSNHPVNA